MANIGQMVVAIVGDNSKLDQSIDNSEKKLVAFGKKAADVGKKLTTFVTLPILGIAAASVKAAADMEMQQAAFETMLGSAQKAKTLLQDLTDMAAKTPFQLTDLADATKTMLAFGLATEDVLPYLGMLGDIAQGNSQKLDSLTLAFSQIQSTGRLMGQDLLQLINAGFNPLQEISAKTGESMAELKDRMAAGAITSLEVADAFRSATSEGGRFYGGMEKASQTLTGMISTLKDNIAATGRAFGEVLLPALKNLVTRLSDITLRFTAMDKYTKQTIMAVAGLVAVVGPLALIIGKTITAAAALKAAMVALNITMAANPVLLIVAGLAALVTITAVVIKSTGLLRTANERYAEQLRDSTEAVKQLSIEEQKRARAGLLQEQMELQKQLADAQEKQAAAEKAWADEQARLVKLGEKATVGTREMAYAARSVQMSFEAASRSTEELSERNDILSGAIDEVNASIEELEATEAARKEFEDMAVAEKAAAEEAAALARSLSELNTQQKEEVEELAMTEADIAEERRRQREIEEQELYATLKGYQDTRDAANDLYEEKYRINEAEEAQVEETVEERKVLWDGYYMWLADMSNRSFAARAEEDELYTAALDDMLQRRKESWADYAATVAKINADLTNALMGFYSSLFDRKAARLEEEITDEEDRDKAIRKLRREEAVINKSLAAFNAVINTAVAVTQLLATPWLAIAAGVTGALQLAAILAEPLPALAKGGIVPASPGGQPVIVGEGGSPEAVVPLDEIGRFISSLPSSSGAGGDMRVIVNLDGKPIIDTVAAASRDRSLIIDARAVVA